MFTFHANEIMLWQLCSVNFIFIKQNVQKHFQILIHLQILGASLCNLEEVVHNYWYNLIQILIKYALTKARFVISLFLVHKIYRSIHITVSCFAFIILLFQTTK